MKYLGKITDPKDLVTKEYVDNIKDINPYDVFRRMGVPVNRMKLVDVGRNYLRRVRRRDDL